MKQIHRNFTALEQVNRLLLVIQQICPSSVTHTLMTSDYSETTRLFIWKLMLKICHFTVPLQRDIIYFSLFCIAGLVYAKSKIAI